MTHCQYTVCQGEKIWIYLFLFLKRRNQERICVISLQIKSNSLCRFGKRIQIQFRIDPYPWTELVGKVHSIPAIISFFFFFYEYEWMTQYFTWWNYVINPDSLLGWHGVRSDLFEKKNNNKKSLKRFYSCVWSCKCLLWKGLTFK